MRFCVGGITDDVYSDGKTFEENSTLEGILADLIIPAVKRKELALREKGLVSLGLCCLIAKVGSLFIASRILVGELILPFRFNLTAHGYQLLPTLPRTDSNGPRDPKDPRSSDSI
jgi:hypothetical protein